MAHIACVASLFLILTQRSTGQRKVTVPKGPLVRGVGYPLSLGCNVTDYPGSSQQDFQWSVHPPHDLTLDFVILGTADSFTHLNYIDRVREGDISLQRLRGDAVELRFSKLQEKDSGEYVCSTRSTSETSYGTYNAKVFLTVIPDTLTATMRSQKLSRREGQPLELTCEVSKATTQHTHLSVTFYHLKQIAAKNQATEMISLSQDFEMVPGSSRKERFDAGDLRLYKLGKTSFRLSIRKVHPSDQGRLYCEAKEWIQDPDGTWTSIFKKETEETTLSVQASGRPPQGTPVRDLQVSFKTEGTPEQGKTLELLCEEVASRRDPQLQASWFINGTEMISFDPVGVVDFKGNYKQQASQGLLQAMKLSPRKFSLKIFTAGPESQGTYRCEMTEVEKSDEGAWQVIQKTQSQNNLVQLKKPDGSDIQVTVKTVGTPEEGKTLQLLCEVEISNSDPQLQATWLFNGTEITHLDPGGVVDFQGDYTKTVNQELLQVIKLSPKKFSLKILSAAPENQGTYRCEVAEMTKSRAGSWQLLQKNQSPDNQVKVTKPKGSYFQVTIRTEGIPKEGKPLELICEVVGSFSDPQLQVSWFINGTEVTRFDPGGVVDFKGDYSQQVSQGLVQFTKSSPKKFSLNIFSVGPANEGTYRCDVTEMLKSRSGSWQVLQKKQSSDNDVQVPEPEMWDYQVTITTENIPVVGRSLQLFCEVVGTYSDEQIRVTWFLNGTEISSLDPVGVVDFKGDYRQRANLGLLQVLKLSPTKFSFKVFTLGPEYEGTYRCEVAEMAKSQEKSWQVIQNRRSRDNRVQLTQPDVIDFQVTIKIEGTPEEGKTVELLCEVESSDNDPQFQVIWFFSDAEIIRLDPGGVVNFKGDYMQKANQELVQVIKLNSKKFSLKILSAGPDKQGTYRCEVAEMTKSRAGSWKMLQKNQSPENYVQLVKIEVPTAPSPTSRNVTVSNRDEGQPIWEGGPLALLCKTSGAQGLLSVRWWHIPQGQTQQKFMASMEKDGTILWGASSVVPGTPSKARLEKKDWATFELKFSSMAKTDSGTYLCKVKEHTQDQASDHEWSEKVEVTIQPLESSLQVSLTSRQPQAKLANTFDLSCLVTADYSKLKVPLTMTWMFQQSASQVFDQILQISHDGMIAWGDSLASFQKKTKVSQSSFHSQLLVHDVSKKEEGEYQCRADVYDRTSLQTDGPVRASARSPSLRIDVTLPSSQLEVYSQNQVQETSISSDTEIKCNILSWSTKSPQFTIIWYFAPIFMNGTWMKILEMDHTYVVKYGDEFLNPQRKQKFHSQRVSRNVFQLHILYVEDNDQGQYRCTVEEWLSSTDGSWHKLGEKQSGQIELKLISPGSEVRVSKVHATNNATENTEAVVSCSLESASANNPSSLFSVMWFWNEQQLLQQQHDGLVTYQELGHQRQRRMRCHRPSSTEFLLMLYPVQMEDAGTYHCRVTEWQLQMNSSKWVSQASDQSQPVLLKIRPEESSFASMIYSSAFLPYLLVIAISVLSVLLLISLLSLARKARKLSMLSQQAEMKDPSQQSPLNENVQMNDPHQQPASSQNAQVNDPLQQSTSSQNAQMNDPLHQSTSSQNAQMNDPLHQSTSSQNAHMNDPLQQSSNQNAHRNDPLQLHKKESKSSTGTIKRNKTTKHSRHLSL